MEHRFFDPENYAALIAAVGREAREGDADAPETLEFIGGHMRNLLSYVHAVGVSEVGIRIADGSMEGESMRSRITELDRSRSRSHDAAIASTSTLNRIAAAYGIGPLFTGDPARRREVAAFCMEVTAWLFENRR